MMSTFILDLFCVLAMPMWARIIASRRTLEKSPWSKLIQWVLSNLKLKTCDVLNVFLLTKKKNLKGMFSFPFKSLSSKFGFNLMFSNHEAQCAGASVFYRFNSNYFRKDSWFSVAKFEGRAEREKCLTNTLGCFNFYI